MAYDTKGGAAGTVGRQGLQGATFGFSDELIDNYGLGGAIAYAKAFQPDLLPYLTMKEARQSSKQDLAKDWENAPITSFASQAAGSIPLGLTKAAGNVANWASSGSKLMAAAKGGAVGAGYGGISGLGAGEDTLLDRAKSGASGAALGAVLGSALSPLARYGQSPVTPPDQADIAAKSVKSLPKGATKAQKMMAEMLAKRPDIAAQLARAEAMDAASKASGISLTLPEKLAQSSAEPLLAQQAKIGANPQTAGMMEKFYSVRSGTPNQAGQIENALMNKVKQLSPNTQNYDDLAQILIDKAGQKTKDITGKLVSKSEPLYTSGLAKSLPIETKTTYQMVDNMPIIGTGKTQVVNSELENLMSSNPVVNEFINRALTTKDPSLLKQVSGKDANSIAVLDAAKKLIDQSMKGYGSEAPANPRALQEAKDLILSMADKYAPEYAQARGIYSGQPDQLLMRQQIGSLADIDPMKAKQVGNQLFSGTQQNAQMTAQALGQEGAKQAAAARVLNVMDTARGEPQTWASKIAPDQRTKEMLDIYAGKGQFDDLLNVINQAKIGDRYKYGSPTEPLQSANNSLEAAANAGVDLVTGNKIGLLRKAAGMLGMKSPEDNPAFYQEMADLMTTDKGMDLLRQVASGNKNAMQVLQSGTLMKRGAMSMQPLLNQSPVTRAAIGGINAPMQTMPQDDFSDIEYLLNPPKKQDDFSDIDALLKRSK